MAYTGYKDIATQRAYRQLLQNSLRGAADALAAQLGKNGYSLGTTEKPKKPKARK